MKKTLYTFLVWDLLLFAMGLSELIFYRDLTLREGAVVSWTQPALVSLTSFLILISIYYGLYQLFFGKRFCMKTEMDAEELEAFRSQTLNFLKKEKIDPAVTETPAVSDRRREHPVGDLSCLSVRFRDHGG